MADTPKRGQDKKSPYYQGTVGGKKHRYQSGNSRGRNIARGRASRSATASRSARSRGRR